MLVKRRIGAGSMIFVLFGATGCVMPDQVSQIQKDVADVRQQMRVLQDDQDQAQSRLAELETRVSSDKDRVTRSDLADLETQVRQLGRDIDVAEERMNDFGRQVDQVTTKVQEVDRRNATLVVPLPIESGRGAAPPGDPQDNAGGGAVPDADALYNTAYTDFSKGNYTLAVSGFEEFHEKFSDSPLADNALYWIGECHYSQGSFPDAIGAFDRLLESHPESDKAAAANLKKGLAYLEQNQISQAIIQLRFVVSSYSGSDEAKIARDKLVSLGAPV